MQLGAGAADETSARATGVPRRRLGDVEQAQENLAVGVGALAGSTIMLLTVPFALSLYAGRVDLVHGVAEYGRRPAPAPDPLFLASVEGRPSYFARARAETAAGREPSETDPVRAGPSSASTRRWRPRASRRGPRCAWARWSCASRA